MCFYFLLTLLLKVTLQKYHKEVFNHAKLYQNYNNSNEVIRLVKEGYLKCIKNLGNKHFLFQSAGRVYL